MCARVLVIDDDATFLEFLVSAVERGGHVALPFRQAGAALSALGGLAPDLVITDLFMPQRDGIEVVRHLAAHHPNVPVIAVTGAPQELYRRALVQFGATAVLSKPVAAPALLAEITRLLAAVASRPSSASSA